MGEQRLWAPWRMEYIEGPKAEECIFCAAIEAADDAERHVVRVLPQSIEESYGKLTASWPGGSRRT